MTTARNPGDGAPRPSRSQAGDLLTDVVVATLRLNGRVVEVAQRLAAAGGLTAAWWQVLGGSWANHAPSPTSPAAWG